MTDETLTYPLDHQTCQLCGEPAIAWPEGLHHVNEAIDEDHEPLIQPWDL